jgi:hypothetical protein
VQKEGAPLLALFEKWAAADMVELFTSAAPNPKKRNEVLDAGDATEKTRRKTDL